MRRTISTLPSQLTSHRIFSACIQGIKHQFPERDQDEINRISACFSTALSRWQTSEIAFILNEIVTQLIHPPQIENGLFQHPRVNLSDTETQILRELIHQTQLAIQTQQTPEWASFQSTEPDTHRPIR